MIETSVLGRQAAEAMGYLDENEDMDGGKILSCMIVVVVEAANGETSFTRTFSSDRLLYQQIGLCYQALDCVRDGFRFDPPAEAFDEDEDDDE